MAESPTVGMTEQAAQTEQAVQLEQNLQAEQTSDQAEESGDSGADPAGEGKGAQAETDAAVAAGNSSDAAVGNLDAATLDSEAASSESTSAAMSESTVAETEESADVAETEPVEEEKSYLTSPLTAEAGGLKVTVTPTEDAALPEDTQLDVREITSSDTAFQGMEEEAEKTAWEQNGKVEDMSAALPYEKFLAISLKEGDQEIEPQAQVGVKVELADTDASLIRDGVSFGVLHYTDGEAVSVTPQVDTQSDDDKEENKIQLFSFSAEDTADNNEHTVLSFDTESFSDWGFYYTYTVDFYYDGQRFSLPGEGETSLDEIMKKLSLSPDGKVVKAVYSSPEQLAVGEIDDGNCTVKSLQPFTSSETLTLTTDQGTEYIIHVMDPDAAQEAPKSAGEVVHDFDATVFYGGAKQEDGKYVWTARSHAKDHRFSYRVSFGLGDEETGDDMVFAPGTVKITVPKTILVDREGKQADYYEMSVPSMEEVKEAEDNGEELDKEVLFAYKEDGDQLVITNIRDIDPGFDGFIEMSYLTSEETFAYKDMAPSKEFTATITAMDPSTVKDKDHPDGVWTEPQTKTVDPVYIDTQVKLASMEERVPAKYDKWQASWGTAPETVTIPGVDDPVPFKPDNYTYFVYEICSRIGDNSQEYAVSINDTISRLVADGREASQGSDTGFAAAWYNSKGSYAIGQKSSEPKGQYEKESGLRYDYVILAFDKKFITNTNKLEITNDTTETVHPRDDDENNSQATSQTYQRRFVWNKPVFRGGGGGFGGWVRADGFYRYQEGRDEWPREYFTELGNHAGNYSGYNLNDLTDDNKSISGLDFAVWSEGYIGSWSVDRNVTNPNNASKDDYYKEPVRYEVTDNRFYLTDENDGTSSAEKDRLTSSDDYQIDTLRFNIYARDPVYDENTAQFVGSDKVTYEYNEELVFEVQTGTTEAQFVQAAVYNLKTGAFSDVDNSIITKTDTTVSGGPEIQFKDGVVGYRVTTKNKHYYFRLGMVPSVSLKPSRRVLDVNKTGSATESKTESFSLNNQVITTIYDYKNKDGVVTKPGDPDEFTHVVWGPAAAQDADFIRKVEKESSLTKDIVASTNLQKKKEYRVTWKIHADESYNFGQNEKGYVEQKSGTFYDLLPVGAVLDPDSVLISTNDEELPSSSFKVDTVASNYNKTGRTLVKITVYDAANWYDLYYDTVHTYESIRDYGNEAYNSVAYQTGNDSISDFYKETGEHTKENKIRQEFDLYQSDTEANPEKRNQEESLLYSAVGQVLNKTNEEVKTDSRLIFRGRDGDIAAITSAASGLSKKILSDRSSRYDSEAVVDNNGAYHYQLRFQNSYSNSSEKVVLYDALENYNNAGRSSDWKGELTAIDFSALPKDENGNGLISPAIYYSTKEQNYEGNQVPALSDPVWNKLTLDKNGAVPENLQKEIRAIAIDLGTGTDGKAYQLDRGQALTVSLTMKAPAGASRQDGTAGYPEAYNGVAVSFDRITDTSSSQRVSQVGCTRAKLVISRDVNLEKRSSKDNTQIRGISFRLSGTSDYGTAVDKILSTDRNGELTFARVEKGTYTLMEYGSVPDWLDDHTAYTVKIDDNGRLWITNPKKTDKPQEYVRTKADASDSAPFWFTVYNDPRIHADLRFYKARQTTKDNDALTGIPDTTFELSGTSDYGNDVVKTATSDSNGLVKLDNIEKGTYTLREIKANTDYILNSRQYQVRVDEAGTASLWKPVDDAGTAPSEVPAERENADGSSADNNADAATVSYTAADTIGDQPVIFNTPAYWDISFLKVDKDLPTRTLEGAKFELSGINLAEPQEQKSNENGRVTFKHLKSGSYILKEVQAPAGVNGEGKVDNENGVLNYTADASDYLIDLNEDGMYTIRKADNSAVDQNDKSGSTPAADQGKTADSAQTAELAKNADGDYLFPDERALDGQITIIKKWEDDSDNDNRPAPVIHLETSENHSVIKGAKVVVEWLNDYASARPNTDNGVTVTIVDSKGTELGSSSQPSNTSGNLWIYKFPDVTLQPDEQYYAYESQPVSIINNGKYTGSAVGNDYKVSLINGKATISNTYKEIYDFLYTGNVQKFTAPHNGYYKLEVWGASGGDYYGTQQRQGSIGSRAGYGGYSSGTILLNSNQQIYVIVGEQGKRASAGSGMSPATYNGGGSAVNGGGWLNCSGGGMTHMSTTQNVAVEGQEWNTNGTILVAGGGGGADNSNEGLRGKGYSDDGGGGDGGGQFGGNAYIDGGEAKGTGGGQQAAQYPYNKQGNGQPYLGGHSDSGAGGGGWYGGKVTNNNNGGAGGGSGYIDKDVLTDASTISGSESIPDPNGGTEQGHFGNGFARITYISANSPAPTDSAAPGSGSQQAASNTSAYQTDKDGWVKDGNTWKYTMPVFDDTATYTYWEDPVKDYTSDAPVSKEKAEEIGAAIDGSESKTLIVTNTAGSAYGSLTVLKKVVDRAGNGLKDSTQDFTFTLALEGPKISGIQSFGGNVYTNGTLTFTLHEGQSKTFEHISAGTTYTVKEAANVNYNNGNALADQTGSITGGQTSSAEFTNTFTPAQKSRTDVKLIKKTEGSVAGAESDEYPFHAVLTGLDPDMEFSIQIGTEDGQNIRVQNYTTDAQGNADVTLSLKSGETAVFGDLPEGAQYQFIEDAGKWTARFAAVNEAGEDGITRGTILQSSGQNTAQNQTLATQTETVEDGEKTIVTFTNTLSYTQQLTIKKTVKLDGDAKQKDPNEKFEITVTVTGLKPGAKIDTDSVGYVTADDTGEAVKTFYLKNGQSAVFRNIPVSAKYQVKETANDYVGSYEITATDAKGNLKQIANGKNDAAKKDLNTTEQTITRGENPTVELISGQRWSKVTICKVDPDGKQLKGAIFMLYQGTGSNRKLYPDEKNAVMNLGEKTLTLPSGTYQLEEKKAPKGYIIEQSCKSITFRVNADGTVTLMNADGQTELDNNSPICKIANVSTDDDTKPPVISITNKAGTRLPSTGGMDVRILLLLALAMIGSALWGFRQLARDGRRKER